MREQGERFHRRRETCVVRVVLRVDGRVGSAEDRPGVRGRRSRFFNVGEWASAGGQIAGGGIHVGGIGQIGIRAVCRVQVGETGVGSMEIGGVSRRRGMERTRSRGDTRIRASDIGAEEVRETITVCFPA